MVHSSDLPEGMTGRRAAGKFSPHICAKFTPHICAAFLEEGERWGKRPEPLLCVKGENFEFKKKRKKERTTLAFICRLCDKNTL